MKNPTKTFNRRKFTTRKKLTEAEANEQITRSQISMQNDYETLFTLEKCRKSGDEKDIRYLAFLEFTEQQTIEEIYEDLKSRIEYQMSKIRFLR